VQQKKWEFNRILSQLRNLRGFTQAELGKRAGIPAAAISHFENSQRQPSPESLRRLAQALSVSVDYLIGLQENPKAAGRVSKRSFVTLRR